MIIDVCYENIDNPLYFLIYRLRGFMVNQPNLYAQKKKLIKYVTAHGTPKIR